MLHPFQTQLEALFGDMILNKHYEMLRMLLRHPSSEGGNILAALNAKVTCDRLGLLWGKVSAGLRL